MTELPPIEIVEPAAYRAVVNQHATHAVVEVQHGGAPWVTMQLFRVKVPSTAKLAARRREVVDEARAHGWALPLDWPRARAGVTILDDIVALDWSQILQGVTAHRARLQQVLDQVDTAWQECLVDTHRVGQVPVADLAAIAGVSKPRVYQVLKEHPTDKLTQTQALIEQSKRRLERSAAGIEVTGARRETAKKEPAAHQATPGEALGLLSQAIADGRASLEAQVTGEGDLRSLPAEIPADALGALTKAVRQLSRDVKLLDPTLSRALGKLARTVSEVAATIKDTAGTGGRAPAREVLGAMDDFQQLVDSLASKTH